MTDAVYTRVPMLSQFCALETHERARVLRQYRNAIFNQTMFVNRWWREHAGEGAPADQPEYLRWGAIQMLLGAWIGGRDVLVRPARQDRQKTHLQHVEALVTRLLIASIGLVGLLWLLLESVDPVRSNGGNSWRR